MVLHFGTISVAMLCCAKIHCCELFCATSPYNDNFDIYELHVRGKNG